MTRTLLAVLFALIIPIEALALTPPRDGGKMPDWYQERIREDRNAFQFQHAWIKKVEQIKKNREAYIADKGFYSRQLVAVGDRPQYSVTGTVQVPVFLSKFSNTGADPFTVGSMQARLFDGPDPNQTLTELYTEMSYGDITMTGTVFGWTQLSQIDTYYEGPANCNGLCLNAQLDDYIFDTLADQDGQVNFAIYDNDGLDGIPNSGDDDGYVDFVVFVHPEVGAECGGTPINIWSHRWTLNGLAGSPYTTNDPANGGGFIRVNDYVIQPIYNCDGTTLIDIGVFAHEFGHAFGLPDLYDTNGGSNGIGHWGLMGSGSWNSTDFPAHMNAWSKSELGWVNLIEVSGKKTPYAVTNVEQNRPVYRLNIMDERWRRMTDCALSGSYSMRCGLLAGEGTARNWSDADGYGDHWDDRVVREFSYNGGSHPVSLQFDYDYESEPTYDFTYVRINVGGTVTTLATYDGVGAGTANIDLTPYLDGSGVSTYEVSFHFESDVAWSDRDGLNATICGPFVVDDISLTGGGEAYSTDFEADEDGWHQDMTDPREYFLVENRQAILSDVNLWGGGGLVIWHINDDVASTGQSGNSSGASGLLIKGVQAEQADNAGHLDISPGNRGDAGDPFPGSSTNTTFNNASAPSSRGASGTANNACVINIPANPGSGGSMTATMSGGWGAPSYTSQSLASADNNQIVNIQVNGGAMYFGAYAELVQGGTTIAGLSLPYDGRDHVLSAFDLSGAPGGLYDLVIYNQGGACTVVTDAFTVNDVVTAADDTPGVPGKTALGQNYPNPFNPTTVIPFDLKNAGAVDLRIYNIAGQVIRTLVNENLAAASHRVGWDGRNDAGQRVASGVYFYKLIAGDFQDVRKLLLMK